MDASLSVKDQLRAGFIIAGGGATLAIVATDYFDASALWQVLLPVGIMVLYEVMFWIRNYDAVYGEMHGDSMYYMGFMLTIVSLILLFIHCLGEVGHIDSMQVMGKFGVALTTTLVGLLCRSVHTLFLSDSHDEYERQMQLVAEQLEILKMKLSKSVERFEILNTAMAVESEQILTQMHETAEGLFTKPTEALEVMIGQVGNSVEECIGTVVEETGKAQATIVERTRGMADSMARQMEEAVTSVVKDMGKSQADLADRTRDMVATLTTDVNQAVATVVAQLESVSIDPQGVEQRLDQGFGEIAVALDGFTQRISQSRDAFTATLEQFNDTLGKLADFSVLLTGMEPLGQQVGDMQGRFATLASAVEGAAGQFASLHGEIQASASKSRELVGGLEQQIGALGALASDTGAVHGTLEEHRKALAALVQSIHKEYASLQAFAGEMTGKVQDIATTLGDGIRGQSTTGSSN